MAIPRAMYVGKDNIMEAFERFDNPYFSVWVGKDLLIVNNDEDRDKAIVNLEDMLSAGELNGNNDLITIKLHPKPSDKGFLSSNSPVVGTMFVRCVDTRIGNIQPGYNSEERLPMPMYKAMTAIEGLPALIDGKLAGLEERLKAVEEKDPEELDTLGRISGMLQNPVIAGLVERFLPQIMGAIMPGAVPPQPVQPRNMQVAGINTPGEAKAAGLDEAQLIKLDASLQRLMPHCDLVIDLGLLADMAENNPQMFAFLLSNLRSNGN